MYAYLEGVLTYKSPSLLYMDVNGVGYEVHITLQTFGKIQDQEKCKLLTHLHIREDAWVVFGFANEQERTTFRSLLSINGVGAATARIILSSLTPEELERAVATDDTAILQKVKGIGGKTAQRIILELKGKLSIEGDTLALPTTKHNTIEDDALFALVNLGISKQAAQAALKKVPKVDYSSVEELIKLSLKVI